MHTKKLNFKDQSFQNRVETNGRYPSLYLPS